MINSFKELGKLSLKGLTDSERKRKFLDTQTIVPNEPDANDENREKYREIIINLDTSKEEIEITLGEELYRKNRYNFFGFELLGKRSKKIYFTTNNLYYHLYTIPDILRYISEKMSNDSYNEFSDYLEKLQTAFYDVSQKNSFLKLDKFNAKQKDNIIKYIDGEASHSKMNSALQEYVSKDLLGSSKRDFINNLNIFSLKIDGKYITETKFRDLYIDMIYYERQGRFFDKSEKFVKLNNLCNVCNESKLVSGKIDIPTKFYITDKPYFYENLSMDNAYKSFAICEDCYQEVMIGIKEIESNYSDRLFYNYRYYLIPRSLDEDKDYEKQLSAIQRMLSGKRDTYEEDVKHLRSVKGKNLKLDFLFWYRPAGQAAAFVVAENISDVPYSKIYDLLRELNELNRLYRKHLDLKTNMNSIYWLLYPNKYSHNSFDSSLYRKDILSLFKSLIKGRDISYSNLIRNFNSIFKKKYFKSKGKISDIAYTPLQMNILLTWFNRVAKLKGGFKVTEGQSFIEIEDKDIKEFFEVHSDIYKDNYHRQGLVILGVLINEILKEQQSKSSTILNKLDFDGLGVRRVKRFIIDVTESLEIYNKFKVNQVRYAQMMDRLQGIENSKLTKDEVVFYILSGISLGRYMGHKYSQEKKKKENIQEGDINE